MSFATRAARLHPVKQRLQSRSSCRIALTAVAVTCFASAIAGGSPNTTKRKDARPSLYEIGYSHLDTQWCWSYPQVIREFIPNTLHENFALFKKYPNYVFNWTGSNRYRFMKEYYPADYAELKKYVAERRWFPAGSSVEEGDVNSPSGESLIRQVLYGNEFFRKEFGVTSSEYMLPDCFGFPASLPSILAHCGLKGFSTQKLTWGSAVGIPFNVGKWVGPDGRSIVAALNPGAYDSDVRVDLATDPRWVARLQRDAVKDGVAVDYSYYGVGDRGGAPDEDSVKLVQKASKESGPVHVFAGAADQMFNDLSAADVDKLPTYKGDLELTEHSAGSLTSEGAVKRWNRKNELLANEAESASVIANWLGTVKYDKSRITDAWLRFLPGQFHDLMAGTALPVAYNYTWNDQVLAMNEFADVLENSVSGVARALDTRSKGVPLTVYNPLSWTRDDCVEAEVRFPGFAPSQIQVFDSAGKPVPTQLLSRTGESAKILFQAQVPSLGFSVFDVREGSTPQVAGAAMKVSRTGLENSRYAVKLGGGDVTSIYDKLAQKELLAAPLRLVYMHENPSQFPAWNMDWADQKQRPQAIVGGGATIEVVENGPVRVALRITRRHQGSKFVQTLRLGSGDAADRLDFATQIDWQGTESALKAAFPLTVSNPQATYNWGPGTVKRGNNDPRKYEVGSHGWFDLTNRDGDYGVSILSDCKYGSDKPSDSMLRLTLIYTPGVKGGYQHQGTQDWGRNEMTYALVGHRSSWEHSNTQAESAELSQPLVPFQTSSHPGSAGGTLSLASVSDPRVSLDVVKQAETGDEVIVRFNELSGEDHPHVRVHFASAIRSAQEVDGQERQLGVAKLQGGDLVFDAHPYQPRAFALRLAKPLASAPPLTSVPLPLPYNLIGISSGFGAHDANFDGAGNSIPGDMVPDKIVSGGVEFKLGSKGRNNVLVPDGQTIPLPPGRNRKLIIVGASAENGSAVPFRFGTAVKTIQLQGWDGFIGQWDNRSWGGEVPELAYDWQNPLTGLQPGFIHRQPVVWYSDHKRDPAGSNAIYQFCYLFRASVDVPDGAKEVLLPKAKGARIAAMSLVANWADETRPAALLYDELDRQGVDGPGIQVDEPVPHAEKLVTLTHPLYWSTEHSLHYTLDGTAPSAASPVYRRPFALGSNATIAVASMDKAGNVLATARRAINVDDSVPATVIRAIREPSVPGSGEVVLKVQFSEEVDRASAENRANYWPFVGTTFIPSSSAKLEDDGRTVAITFPATPLEFTGLKVRDVKDLGGLPCSVSVNIKALSPVFTLPSVVVANGTESGPAQENIADLPVAATAPWSMNLFLKVDHQPAPLTVLAGFGSGGDEGGAERFLISNEGRLFFWGSNIDIDSGTPLDVGKWQMISVTYDGKTLRIYRNGLELKSQDVQLSEAVNRVLVAPGPPWSYGHRFSGQIAGFTIWNEALSASALSAMLAGAPH